VASCDRITKVTGRSDIEIAVVSPYPHAGAMAGARVRAEKLCEALAPLPGVRMTTLAPFVPAEHAHHIDFDLEGSMPQRLVKLARLNRILHSISPDVVISEAPLDPIGFGRFKIVHVIHDTKFAGAHGRRRSNLARHLHGISVRNADAVMTVSHAEAVNIRALYGADTPIIVSYNGLSSAWIDTPAPDGTWEHDILYVSNFAAHKGHSDLIEATAGSAYRIALVGSDFGHEAAIRQSIGKSSCRFDIYANLDEASLIRLYDRSAIKVFPSRLEGFGMPFLEARSRGLPVVANDLPVFRELSGLVGGELVDCSDHVALRSAITKALGQPARAYPDPAILSAFKWEQIARQLITDTSALFWPD
jgi:glycosyltransferase involved in cell wall biosynthesis